MARSTSGLARGYNRLRDNAGLGLLKAEHMPVLAAVLGEHLGGSQRILPATEFLTELDADLAELRDHGFDLPRTAQQYLSEWVRQGILIRRPGEGREETVELSAPAGAALGFLAALSQPRSAVNSSRLANVSTLLGALARETDPDRVSRIAALREEQRRLEAEIARVESGDFTSLADVMALERLQEIFTLAAEIPADFAQVSAELEELNRDLKEEIVRAAGSRGEVLDAVFAGVDVIEESEAGRSFRAFYAMVLDAERSAAFDDSVDEILDRPFAADLSVRDTTFLRGLLTTLQEDSGIVRTQMTGLSRSLRRFVETQSWQEQQRLATALNEAQKTVLSAMAEVNAIRPTDYELVATSIPLASISSWRLHNPADVRTAEEVIAQPTRTLDLIDLRRQVRESEIDMKELQKAVHASVTRHGSASIARVLEDHPASQGLASIIGLIILAEQHATRTVESEELAWVSGRGVHRRVLAPRFVFTTVPTSWRTVGPRTAGGSHDG